MRKILTFVLLLPACFPTETKPVACNTDQDCQSKIGVSQGVRCDLTQHACVCDGTGYPGCDKFVDAGTSLDSATSPDLPATPIDGSPLPDSATDVAIADTPTDVPAPDRAADMRVPDAAGTCGTDKDCTDPARGFCVGNVCTGCSANLCASRVGGGGAVCATAGVVAGQCVECVADGQCTSNPAKSFCVNNACTGCTAALCGGNADGGANSVCATAGIAAGQCVECVADGQCTRNTAKGFCVNNVCTGCTAALCAGTVDGGAGLVCATTGTAAGQCVECVDDTTCTKDAAKGFCVSNACTGCQSAGANACTGAKPACAASGASAGQCVECIDNGGCTANIAKGFCVTNTCTGCTAALCAGRTDGKTACATAGTFAGQCVTCTSNAQCAGTTPICSATTDSCRACANDGECSTVGPGVCMTDGHCATDAEAIYVGTLGGATCSASNTGTAQAPVCTAQAGVGLAKSGSKPVVVIRGALTAGSTTISVSSPLTIVGKNGALLTPADPSADAITITSGEITLRNLTVQGTASPKTGIGINAGPVGGNSVTLHIDTCAVTNNPGGGILLNGAAFDIKNTTVTGNGPGQTGSTTWGGIFVQSLPPTGPTNLNLVSVNNNVGAGVACAGSILGSGILATGNTSTTAQITTSCSITPCTPASTTCGAQTTPQ